MDTTSCRSAWRGFVCLVVMLLVSPLAAADGTETLGPTPIAPGSGTATSGVGLFDTGSGTLAVEVPGAPTQAYLYWLKRDESNLTALPATTTLLVDGVAVTGTRIGGTDDPSTTVRASLGANRIRYYASYRADVTALVVSGLNTLDVDAGAAGVTDGAGIVVSFDDGGTPQDIGLRDGADFASSIQDAERLSTVEQVFAIAPAGADRQAKLSLLVGDVGNDGGSIIDRVQVTVDGTVTVFDDILFGDALWVTTDLAIDVPAGAGDLAVQLCSGHVCPIAPPNRRNSSLVWVAAGMSITPEQQPDVAVGDRVFEDLNGNGQQDCVDGGAGDPANPADGVIGNAGDAGPECDAGVPDVTVTLLQGPDCTIAVGPSTSTDADGSYLFEHLAPGDYCVQFDPSTVPAGFCAVDINGMSVDLGDPVFTSANVGPDASDSDADPSTGATGSAAVPAGQNLTLDAGLLCPAKIGDLVFEDTNRDGVQDPGDTVIPGVEVELVDCGPDGMVGGGDDVPTGQFRTTDSDGMYMFGGEPGTFSLDPGTYHVRFNPSSFPAGYSPTVPDNGAEDRDSDCMAPDGGTSCVALDGSRSVNLDRDCGLVPPQQAVCDLLIDKTCRIEPRPVTGEFECDKPIDQLTMIWDGSDDVRVNVWKGDVGSTLLADQALVGNGGELTVSGYAGSPNNVYWEVFDALTGNKLGESVFHLSCSDDDMDGPEDCGNSAGDGKDNDSDLINDWLLEGMVDSKGAFDCNVAPTTPVFPDAQACEGFKPVQPSCDTVGKPEVLTFQYTGGGCAASANSQSASKAECSEDGIVAGDIVVVGAAGDEDFDKDVYDIDPTLVSPGGTFTISRGGDRLESNTYIQVTDGASTETNALHTSCSQPLAVGDTFGSLTLVGYNGQRGGVDVTYGYRVTNQGDPLGGVNIVDTPLGAVAGPFDLGAGESRQFTLGASISETTTNAATVSGSTAGGTSCMATDSTTVVLVDPPKSCADGDPTSLVFTYTGDDCAVTTNTQEGKFECASDSGLGELASVVMTKDADKFTVAIDGDVVEISRADDPGNSFPSEIKYVITDEFGNSQSHALHTSCSKALEVGDQFGAFILKTFVPED